MQACTNDSKSRGEGTKKLEVVNKLFNTLLDYEATKQPKATLSNQKLSLSNLNS